MTEQERQDHRLRNLKYARSSHGKITRGHWYEQHRASQLRLMRARWRARHPQTKPCKAILCDDLVPIGCLYCTACAAAVYGRSYVLHRKRRKVA